MMLGMFIVSLHVKAGAAHIYASTGVEFWPSEDGGRISWNLMFGSPWISLCSGCAAGVASGLLYRFDLSRQKANWINGYVSQAKGERAKSGVRDIAGAIALIIFIPAPAIVTAFYVPFSALIFTHTAVFVHSLLLYPPLRSYRHEAELTLQNSQLNEEERRNVEQWRTRATKTLKSSFRWVAGFTLTILIATFFFAYHVDRTLQEAELVILERQHEQSAQ